MKTYIKTAHEEHFTGSDGNVQKIVGVLINANEDGKRLDSFLYVYNEDSEMYIIFNTFVDMIDYLLYGDRKVKRAYIKEDDFDNFYDNGIENNFIDHLKWS